MPSWSETSDGDHVHTVVTAVHHPCRDRDRKEGGGHVHTHIDIFGQSKQMSHTRIDVPLTQFHLRDGTPPVIKSMMVSVTVMTIVHLRVPSM